MRITEYMVNRHAEAVRLANAKTAIATAIEGKGVTVPEGTKLDGMAAFAPYLTMMACTPMYTTWRLWPGCASVKTAKHMSVRGI